MTTTAQTPDINTLVGAIAELKRTANALDEHSETYDTDDLWPLLQAITDAKKAVGDELIRRMLAATKEG